jgi:hypothetical protein
MATALLCLDNLVSKSEGKLRAMRHASHTFRLLQPNINRQSAVTDLAITAVISMAQYEHQQQSPTRVCPRAWLVADGSVARQY